MRISDWSSDVCSSDLAGQRHEAAGDVDVAAGQREGVHHRRIEYREGERRAGELGAGDQRRTDPVHIVLYARVRVDAAEFLKDLRVLLAPDRALVRRRQQGEGDAAGGEIGRDTGREGGCGSGEV